MISSQTTDADRTAEAVMEAFRTIRYDREVEALPAGSKERGNRLMSLLTPIAAAYLLSVEDLARALAKSLPYEEEMPLRSDVSKFRLK